MRPLFFFLAGCWLAYIYIISLLKRDLVPNWRLPFHFLWQHYRTDHSRGLDLRSICMHCNFSLGSPSRLVCSSEGVRF